MDPGPERSRTARERVIVQAARQLLAEKPYEAITTREVAAAAGCNHGLITMYFGSKLHLFTEVLPVLADSIAERVATGGHFVDMFLDPEVATYWRLLASLLGAGLDPASQAHSQRPVLDALAERFALVGGIDRGEARTIASHVLMMIGGFHVFGSSFIGDLSSEATTAGAAQQISATVRLIGRGVQQRQAEG